MSITNQTKKNTNNNYQLLSQSLVSGYSRKQYYVALSIIEIEYIVMGEYIVQLLWMMHILKDFQFNYKNIKVLIDKIMLNQLFSSKIFIISQLNLITS